MAGELRAGSSVVKTGAVVSTQPLRWRCEHGNDQEGPNEGLTLEAMAISLA